MRTALRGRFASKRIYTHVNNLLVAVNPYEELPLYGIDVLHSYTQYGEKSPAPHVFGVGAATYRGLLDARSQSVIISGERTGGSTGYMPSRKRLLISATGDVKVLTPSYDLTMLKGVAYMNSPFFPGYIVKARPPRVPDAAIETLEGLWPMDPLTLEVRIRLGSTVEKTFEPWLAAIGEEGTVTSTVGIFSDHGIRAALACPFKCGTPTTSRLCGALCAWGRAGSHPVQRPKQSDLTR